tara:strand:+ start:9486 stop:9782 length:297 start_codon:yes stop_codon:yes gene_type:complete
MVRTSLAVLGMTMLATMPAMAAVCVDEGSTRSFEFSENGRIKVDHEDRDAYDLRMLQQRGIDAVHVERWGSCIQADVRLPDGTQEMQYFNPGSYTRAY